MTNKTQIQFCTIQVLNKTYQIKCPEAETENLQLAAQKLHEEVVLTKTRFKRLNEYQALLLAALHISHDLIKCQNQHAEQRQQLAQFITMLENKINQEAV